MDSGVVILVLAAVVFVVWAIIKRACAFAGIAALLIGGAVFLFFVLR